MGWIQSSFVLSIDCLNLQEGTLASVPGMGWNSAWFVLSIEMKLQEGTLASVPGMGWNSVWFVLSIEMKLP